MSLMSKLPSRGCNYPDIKIVESKGNTYVYWDNKLLVRVLENRYLRFRATIADEKWVGSEKKGTDLGWVYRDKSAKGMKVLNTAHKNDLENREFTLEFDAVKPHFDCKVKSVFKGVWMEELCSFKYILYTTLDCSLETWYENSYFANNKSDLNLNSNRPIEVLDYCIDYISIPERLGSKEHREPQMYEWFVKSEDGENWVKWPKVYIPFPVRKGNYITIRDMDNPSGAGVQYGFLDSSYGGWMTKVNLTPSPIIFEICWALFDVHIQLCEALPLRHSAENLSLEYEMEFIPVTVEESNRIINKAKELPWREMEEYKLPTVSLYNRFDKLVTDLSAKETGLNLIWWASDYNCFRDDTIGYDDNYSVSIKRNEDTLLPSAWSNFTWHRPFSEVTITNKRFRLIAMVKTKNCTGKARIGVSLAVKGGNTFYGINDNGSHNPDGTYNTERYEWYFSEEVKGTTDWTPLSIEFSCENVNGKATVVLEQDGTGQSWFDNVIIEEISQ